MTTKDAIKELPIDETLKLQVLNMYDYMEPAQKLTIQRIAWKTYYILRKERIEADIDREFDEVEEGKTHLGKDFYNTVVKKANQEMVKQGEESIQQVELAAARRAMEQILKEIKAPKKTTKH